MIQADANIEIIYIKANKQPNINNVSTHDDLVEVDVALLTGFLSILFETGGTFDTFSSGNVIDKSPC